MMLKILLAVTSVVGIQGYSSGATSCVTVGHGTFKSPMPSDWTISLHDGAGNQVTTWSAGQTYTAQITGTTTFKGWLWGPLKGTPASFPAGSSNMAGSFAAGDSLSHSVSGCRGSITQTSSSSRTTIKALWTPPAAGTGTVSLWSVMVISKNGNNYNAVLTVNEAPVTASSPSPLAVSPTQSSGASSAITPSDTASPAAAPTPSTSAAAAAAAAAAPVTGSAVTVVTSGANPYNLLAIGLGCTFGGAVAVGLLVVALRRSQPKKILHHVPTVIRMSPLQEAGPNPYTV